MVKEIGIDIDDCSFDLRNPLCRYMARVAGTKTTPDDWTSYDLHNVFGVEQERFVDLLEGFWDSPEYDGMMPEEGAVKALTTFHSVGIKPVMLTSRFGRARERTSTLIQRHLLRVNPEIVYSGHCKFRNGELTKAEICLQRGIQLMVEDARDYALQCAESGIDVILLRRRNNEGTSHKRITPVDNWQQVYEEVLRRMW